ncbi:MAG TPA: hypothetical protein VNO50_11405, partial [Pyrinomonadaceae bacterium]|nr:hypothetical protein [Pyrinomonadaceae bacterium]
LRRQEVWHCSLPSPGDFSWVNASHKQLKADPRNTRNSTNKSFVLVRVISWIVISFPNFTLRHRRTLELKQI